MQELKRRDIWTQEVPHEYPIRSGAVSFEAVRQSNVPAKAGWNPTVTFKRYSNKTVRLIFIAHRILQTVKRKIEHSRDTLIFQRWQSIIFDQKGLEAY